MLFPDEKTLQSVRRILFRWFDPTARELPWRKTSDPYAVWVSEIMLQQTTTQTVSGYFDRFLCRFPNIQTLAEADVDDVLHLWEGLGYYRRARMMHEAAKMLHDRFNDHFPCTRKEIESLPGIGRYTAGAICSIAFDKREPILEANTIRLHARLLGLETPVTGKNENALLWTMAEKILPQARCGLFNQILMDFGASVCVSGSPDCPKCPLRPYCRAAQLQRQDSIPNTGKPTTKEDRVEIAFLIASDVLNGQDKTHAPKYLFLRYPSGGRWTGLWDFPRFLKTNGQPIDQDESLAASVSAFLACSSIQIGLPVYSTRHAVTRFRIELHFCNAFPTKRLSKPAKVPVADIELAAGKFARERIETRFLTLEESESLPLNSTARKFVDYLLAEKKTGSP